MNRFDAAFCAASTSRGAAVVGIPTAYSSGLAVTLTEEERVPEDVKIPRVADLLWPALKAVSEAGGSAMQDEVVDLVRGIAKMTDEQLAVLYPDGRPKVVERTIRAIRALRRIGALDSSQRGVYALTQDGTGYLRMGDADADAALRASYGDHRRRAAKKAAATRRRSLEGEGTVEPGGALGAPAEGGDEDGASLADDGWRTALLEILKGMMPAAFERLAQRILREAGFQKVDVVGRAGDGGIDGVGLYKMSLVSFPIYFQCKRYSGSVSAGVVRDFRGAMVGRGDKGLLTTGTFTPAARAEATRDGTPPVDLIDGTELCDLLLEYKVGVEVRTVRRVTLDETYFANV